VLRVKQPPVKLWKNLKSSDQWAFFQAKSIKASVLATKTSILEAQSQKLDPKDEEKIKQYAEEQKDIKEKAEELGHEAANHLARHKMLASGVTLLQIAIAIGAISALTKKRPFWFLSLLFGLGGVSFLVCELFFFVAKPG